MIALFAALLLQSAAPTVDGPACALTEAARAANRAMTFREFDGASVERPSTPSNLARAGCYAEAAAAGEDYLLHGPNLNEHDRLFVGWRTALNLASAGREAEAAPLVASSVYSGRAQVDGLDWNTHVRGVWGFLRKDRAVLNVALTTLRAAPGLRNAANGRDLARLSKCFDRPYLEAMTSEICAADPATP